MKIELHIIESLINGFYVRGHTEGAGFLNSVLVLLFIKSIELVFVDYRTEVVKPNRTKMVHSLRWGMVSLCSVGTV